MCLQNYLFQICSYSYLGRKLNLKVKCLSLDVFSNLAQSVIIMFMFRVILRKTFKCLLHVP